MSENNNAHGALTTEQLRALHAKTAGQLQERLEAIFLKFDRWSRYSRWDAKRAAGLASAAAHEHWLPLLDEIDRLRGEGPSEEEVARLIDPVAFHPRGGQKTYETRIDRARGIARQILDRVRPQHASDCAIHNAPALPAGACDCGVALRSSGPAEEIRGSDSDVEKSTPGASSAGPITDKERAALKRRVFIGLTIGMLASCTCNTKTPEARFHHEDCPYRIMKDAEAALEALVPATSEPPPSPPDERTTESK